MVAAHIRRVELRSACLRIIAPPNKPRTYKPPTAKRARLSQRHAVSKTHNDAKATHSKFSRGKAVAAKLRATKKVRVARETIAARLWNGSATGSPSRKRRARNSR